MNSPQSPNDLTPMNSLADANLNPNGSFLENNWIVIVAVIFGLAFLGLNVFTYLSEGTATIETAFHPIVAGFIRLFGGSALETTKQTVNTSATGTKGATDITANAITSSIDYVENQSNDAGSQQPQQQPQTGGQNPKQQNVKQYGQFNQMQGINSGKRVGQHVSSLQQNDNGDGNGNGNMENDSLDKALQNAAQNANANAPYQADDAYSSVQSSGSKAGWCLVGQDKGVRSCVEVGENDSCMSGNIFPSHDICVNPNLRA